MRCSRHATILLTLSTLLVGCGGTDDLGEQSLGSIAVARELAYGDTHIENVEAGSWQQLEFEAQAGDVISLYTTGVPRDPAAVVAELALYGPSDGPLLARADGHLIDHTLESSGRHTLLLSHEVGGEVRARLACTGGECRLGRRGQFCATQRHRSY